MTRKGLGKGLDSLIPNYYDEEFDSNSTKSLEDMLEESIEEEKTIEDVEEVDSTIEEEKSQEEEIDEDDNASEEISSDTSTEEVVSLKQDPQVQENIKEVKDIVDKNPRITLWSSRSSAVFRYLRKTEPEFSISKEASILIDEAVSKKYPEIWDLFDDY